jgi:hypothetical protein
LAADGGMNGDEDAGCAFAVPATSMAAPARTLQREGRGRRNMTRMME